MSRRFSPIVMALPLLLTACVSNAPLPDAKRSSSVVEFTKELRVSTSAALDKVIVAIDPGDTATYPWGTSFSTWWCPRHPEVNGTRAAIKQIQGYCMAHGGSVVDHNDSGAYRGFFCAASSNPDLVLFAVRLGTGHSCSAPYETAGVVIEEPRGGNPSSSEYRAHLYKEGFRTAEQRAADQRVAEANAIRLAEEQRRKKAALDAFNRTPAASEWLNRQLQIPVHVLAQQRLDQMARGSRSDDGQYSRMNHGVMADELKAQSPGHGGDLGVYERNLEYAKSMGLSSHQARETAVLLTLTGTGPGTPFASSDYHSERAARLRRETLLLMLEDSGPSE